MLKAAIFFATRNIIDVVLQREKARLLRRRPKFMRKSVNFQQATRRQNTEDVFLFGSGIVYMRSDMWKRLRVPESCQSFPSPTCT